MTLEHLIAQPVAEIRTFDGLVIDAAIWNEAHNQHKQHRRIHALSAHRPGIVYGLEVVCCADDQSVTVFPGVGVDDEGQTLVLSEPVRLPFTERGQLYILLRHDLVADKENSSVPVSVGGAASGGVDTYRTLEHRRLDITKERPAAAPFLELARIFRTGTAKPIRDPDPTRPFDPGNDEINRLHRRVAFPHCFAALHVAELPYLPAGDTATWKPNRAGLTLLARAANGAGFHVDFLSPFTPVAEPKPGADEPDLLYLAGSDAITPFSEGEIAGLTRFLSEGGTLLGEAVDNSEAFQKSFLELAARCHAAPRRPSQDTDAGGGSPVDALLRAHHLFPAVPPGGGAGDGGKKGGSAGELWMDAENGVLFSSWNWGAAWQGSVPTMANSPLTGREQIRQAQEWGMNLLRWAGERKRRVQLQRLA